MSAEPTSSSTLPSLLTLTIAELSPSFDDGPEPWQPKETPHAWRISSLSISPSAAFLHADAHALLDLAACNRQLRAWEMPADGDVVLEAQLYRVDAELP